MKKIGLLAALLLLLNNSSMLYSQQDEQSSLYMYNPLYFNPAYAGSRGGAHLVGIGRFQWVGIEGAPQTQFVSFDLPFRSQSIGVGLHMVHDKIGARERTGVYADFSFAIRLNTKGHRLAFGVNAGADFANYNFSNLSVTNPADPLYLTAYAHADPNFGLGVYYYGEKFFAGVSSPRILGDLVSGNAPGTWVYSRHFYVTGGYVFKLNSVIDFKPTALVKITPNAPLTFDLNANFYFFKRLWAGAMYRFNEGVGVNFAVNITPWMQLGYAFDFPLNDLRLNQYGTHEVMLTLDFRTKKQGVLSPRYF